MVTENANSGHSYCTTVFYVKHTNSIDLHSLDWSQPAEKPLVASRISVNW